jgi:hypothetical protein
MYLAVKKERAAMHRITTASRNWPSVDNEKPTLVPMTA